MRPLVLLLAAPLVACGARTTLELPEPRPDAAVDTTPPPDCTKTEECEGWDDKCAPVACVKNKCIKGTPVVCDDMDPCTDDTCDPATGKCAFEPKTLDLDGDGHRGPLPGKRPGEPGACGDDCDDKSAKAFPGNKEVCDGVDNDCNGVVDDEMHYVPATADPVRVNEPANVPAGPTALAWSGSEYMAGYTAGVAGKPKVFAALLDANGKKTSEQQVTKTTADAAEGRLVWTGAHYGIAWSDRRTSSWEVWFNRLTPKGEKLGPDLRLSEHDETWSINLSIAWTGKEFVVVWQDQRELDPDFGIWGQRVSVDGKLLGRNVKLAEGQGGSPEIAVGLGTLAVAWTVTSGTRHDVMAAIYDRELKTLVEPFRITNDAVFGVFPAITWNGDRYVVAFYDQDKPKKAVYGIAFDEKGAIKTPLRALTDSPRFSRYPSLLPLGDRMLLVWSDTKDLASGYELYAKMLTKELAPEGPERRITNAPGDSIWPVPAFGPSGDVGVLFRDDRLGAMHVWFTRLVCQAK